MTSENKMAQMLNPMFWSLDIGIYLTFDELRSSRNLVLVI
jgi:hypothetical protein